MLTLLQEPIQRNINGFRHSSTMHLDMEKMQFPSVPSAFPSCACIQCPSKDDSRGLKGREGMKGSVSCSCGGRVQYPHTLRCISTGTATVRECSSIDTVLASYLNGTSTQFLLCSVQYMLHAFSPKTTIMYCKIVKVKYCNGMR